MRNNMSLAKRRFSEFNKKKRRFSEFSLLLILQIYLLIFVNNFSSKSIKN